MILGPLSAWILKKFDQAIGDKIPMGFELLVNNYSIGIIGAILGIFRMCGSWTVNLITDNRICRWR